MVGSFSVVYGAIAEVIVMMLWLYQLGFALLVGVELNADIATALSTRDGGSQGPGRKEDIGRAS